MSLLLLLFVLAAVTVWLSVHFLRTRGVAAAPENGQRAQAAVWSVMEEARDLSFIGNAIFSKADWHFILNERCGLLTELFTAERRALAVRWLNDRAERIHAVRAKHVQNSRYSQDLNVLAELRLLVLLQYLIALCWCMLLVVRVAQPTASRTLALHFERMVGRLGTAPRDAETLAHAPSEELHRSHP